MWSSVYICVQSQCAEVPPVWCQHASWGENLLSCPANTRDVGALTQKSKSHCLGGRSDEGMVYRETEMCSSDFTEYHELYLVSEKVCLCEVHLMILL